MMTVETIAVVIPFITMRFLSGQPSSQPSEQLTSSSQPSLSVCFSCIEIITFVSAFSHSISILTNVSLCEMQKSSKKDGKSAKNSKKDNKGKKNDKSTKYRGNGHPHIPTQVDDHIFG